MGIELVEGIDLFVDENIVYMRTTEGPKRVDVIYRRIGDDYCPPLTFRPDAVPGTPGLFSAYRAGNVTLANGVGAGIADDKSIYPYVPAMIRFYLGEEPILSNVRTFRCGQPEELAYVLDHLDELVIKETRGSGGYGMLVGPHGPREGVHLFRANVRAAPHDHNPPPTPPASARPAVAQA